MCELGRRVRIESRPGNGTAFGRDGEGVERDGATVRMKEGGGAGASRRSPWWKSCRMTVSRAPATQ